VADEDHGAVGRELVQDAAQVPAELLDGGVLAPGPLRTTV
jgi:hypothetical protein